MSYSVCIIDNDIPAAGANAQAFGIKDTELLNASNLQLLLNKEEWPDQVIRDLTQTLLDQKDADGISPNGRYAGSRIHLFISMRLTTEFFVPIC
jgi:hypothetical protein